MTTAEETGEELTELLTFPAFSDPRYRDSHEGGQYVMLVVPKPERYGDECCVDVAIQLSPPDVCHTHTDLWNAYDHNDREWRHGGDVYRYLQNRANDAESVIQDAASQPEWAKQFHKGFQYRDWASWAIRAVSPSHYSSEVLAAMHLGSSCHSMWDEEAGRYWTASVGDLTPTGKTLYNSLETAFGMTPLLLTFLDT